MSLDVGEGEVVGVVGGSGAGKSTLALLLSCLIAPDVGSISLEGRDLLAAGRRELKAARQRFQILFQDPFEALSPRLTVAQAVSEPLEIQGVGTEAERHALVLEPKLLVADEPASMLDPSEQAKLFQLLKQLQTERGMALVLVSHDLATVLRVADRVLVLDKGRVVEQGSGRRLLFDPRHPVTRDLLSAAGRDALFSASGLAFDADDAAGLALTS